MDSQSDSSALCDALVGSVATDVMLLCGRALSDPEVDALLTWQRSNPGSGRRRLTIVKSPARATGDLMIRLLSSLSMWSVHPAPPSDPELRLRAKSPALRVRVSYGSRCSTLELTALANGSLLYRV